MSKEVITSELRRLHVIRYFPVTKILFC